MIQQQAFAGNEKMLKGGLHTHSTRSDGKDQPDRVIRDYSAMGYDFLALTDHRIYNLRNYAPELPITIVPGMEFDRMVEEGKGFRCFHTLCLGCSPEDGNPYTQDQMFERGRVSNSEEYQSYLDEFHANHNLTAYCHPQWSNTPARYFETQKGNFAMEIWNTGNALENEMDMDAACWDELLGQGIRIFGIATDDSHIAEHRGLGWVMVRAENDLNAILKALKEGAFYSSCGPEIHNFYVEGNRAFIDCSDADRIRLQSDGHITRILRRGDQPLTHGEFDITGGWEGPYKYVRMTVIDSQGRKAWTNPIFLD